MLSAQYYSVKNSFQVYELVGVSESNTYFGSSRMLGKVYRPLELKEGDELHLLPGGNFAIAGGTAHEIAFELSEKHPFEKVYLPRTPAPPAECVAKIAKSAATPVSSYRNSNHSLPVIAAGRFVGRNIDSILED